MHTITFEQLDKAKKELNKAVKLYLKPYECTEVSNIVINEGPHSYELSLFVAVRYGLKNTIFEYNIFARSFILHENNDANMLDHVITCKLLFAQVVKVIK